MSQSRRKFLTFTTGALAGAGALLASLPFIKSLNPAAHKELQSWDINFEDLKPGEMKVEIIETLPYFITRRTPEQIAALTQLNIKLVDPDSKDSEQPNFAKNNFRSLRPDVFVVQGICTHLGCQPVLINEERADFLNKKANGGYYCPCHAAVFDSAGRVFENGPAPKNMKVPVYEFIDEHTIRIYRI